MSLTDTPKLSTSTSYNYVKHSTCNVYCTGSGDALTGSNADAANRTMLNIAFILFILHYLIYRLILLRAQLFTGPGSPETGGETPFFAPFGSTLSFFLEFLLFFFFFFFSFFFLPFRLLPFNCPTISWNDPWFEVGARFLSVTGSISVCMHSLIPKSI